MDVDVDEVRARITAVHSAYAGLWADFLRNRWAQAEARAEALLRIVAAVPDSHKDAEFWAAEADFLYISGATRGNDRAHLERAVVAYNRSLSAPGGAANGNARRMRAESLLRLHQYEDAFAAFAELADKRLGMRDDVEVAPFRLRHDAALCERLSRLGRLPADTAADAAAGLRNVAERIEAHGAGWTGNRGQRWPHSAQLSPEDVAALRQGLFGELAQVAAPYPAERLAAWLPGCGGDPLSDKVDWARVEAEYKSQRVAVVDGFFSAEALSELWSYACEAPCFGTVRKGFLGAFPADGTVHPLLLATVRSLERRMPGIFQGHPLALWWLFKYFEAPQGIGIHADAAAINVNVWLTPDCARQGGGGLNIYTQLPPDEAGVPEFNHEFASVEEEAALRGTLEAAGPVRHVAYKQNRAAMFVSDLFHASEPFVFPDAVEQPRVNLTFLFGDRTAGRAEPQSPAQAADGSSTEPQSPAQPADGSSTRPGTLCGAVDDSRMGWALFD